MPEIFPGAKHPIPTRSGFRKSCSNRPALKQSFPISFVGWPPSLLSLPWRRQMKIRYDLSGKGWGITVGPGIFTKLGKLSPSAIRESCLEIVNLCRISPESVAIQREQSRQLHLERMNLCLTATSGEYLLAFSISINQSRPQKQKKFSGRLPKIYSRLEKRESIIRP